MEDIKVGEIRGLIHRLIIFLGGPAKVEDLLASYKDSPGPGGSESACRERYPENRHPWWETLEYFVELDHACKTISDNLTEDLSLLAADALMVNRMRKAMPAAVRARYAAGLSDRQTANASLFELSTAWRFFSRGHELSWREDEPGTVPAFSVSTDSIDFDVVCGSVKAGGVTDVLQGGIREFLAEASERMRGQFRPGLAACLLDGLVYIGGAESACALGDVSRAFFADEVNAHIAAVMFGTWPRVASSGATDAVVFMNPSCGYDVAGYDFLGWHLRDGERRP